MFAYSPRRSNFASHLDISVAVVAEYRYLAEIDQLSRVPVCMEVLKIYWGFRYWLGGICSSLTRGADAEVTVSSEDPGGEFEAGRWPVFRYNRRFFSLGASYGYIRLEQSDIWLEDLMLLTMLGGEPIIIARGGRFFIPKLDPSILIMTECWHFVEDLWLYRLPIYMGAVEIAWRYSDWIGVIRSWPICNVRTKWAGNDAASKVACAIAPVRLMRTNSWAWPCNSLPKSHIFCLFISILGLQLRMVVLPSIRAILERDLSQIEEGNRAN